MTIVRTTNVGITTTDDYMSYYQYQKWLVLINTVISSIVFGLLAFLAVAYVRNLKEKGMMVYLVGMIMIS